MQQGASGFAMRKHDHSTHDRSHRIRVHHALSRARHEECSLTALEVVIQVDQESKEGRLAGVWWRGIVGVGVCYGIDS